MMPCMTNSYFYCKLLIALAMGSVSFANSALAGGLSVSVGTPPAFFAPQVQQDLVTRFLGNEADADLLRFSDDLYAGVLFPTTGAALTFSYRHPLSAHWYTEAQLGFGQLRLAAPEGIGIFTDPARASLRYALVGVQLGHAWQVYRGSGFAIEGDLQIGLVAAQVESRLWSALLDVRAQSQVAVGKASFGLALSPAFLDNAVSLQGRVTGYHNGITDFAVTMRYRF